MIQDIVLYPDKRLETLCDPVQEFETSELNQLLTDMFETMYEGLLARAFQHEIDHLNGVLFIRRMSSLKRELLRHKIRKLLRSGDWGKAN